MEGRRLLAHQVDVVLCLQWVVEVDDVGAFADSQGIAFSGDWGDA